MLIECALALISLCAVAFVWNRYSLNFGEEGFLRAPTQVFATGLAGMVASIPGLAGVESIVRTLLILTVSAFCLTSLDTATRLARYMFQEFWLEPGQTYKDVTGIKATLANPYVATAITVALGIALGMNGYSVIWPLFGAANQLLAGLGLLAVCAWLGNIGKNNKMFYVPMIFMLVVTIWSLCQTVQSRFTAIFAGTAAFALAPDMALLVDVSFGDGFGVKEHECGKMNGGVEIDLAPAVNRSIFDQLRQLAQERGIPWQVHAMGGRTGTDTDIVAASGKGVRCGLLSIPLRSMHTAVETVSAQDVLSAARLMAEFAKEAK